VPPVEAARSGHRAAVVVCGPAGVGKSRLVEEAVRRFCRGEDLLLVGHCVDLYGEEIPYTAVAEALRHLVRERGPEAARALLGPAAGPLSVLAPDLGPMPQDDGSRLPETAATGSPVLEAFLTGLERASRETGRVVWLWLEDVQWADRATRTLLSYLLRVDDPPNLLVTTTVRTEDPASPGAGGVVAELLAIPHVDQLDLKPFTRVEVGEHLQALTGSRSRAAVVNAVTLLCGGLPFYTELLARGGLPDGRIPAAVRSMVRGELESLTNDSRTVVEAASVESGRLAHDVLVAVAGGGGDALAGIAGAVSASVLVPEDDGSGYRFRHALLRESVEGGLLPADRRRWHGRWAEQLESSAESTGDQFARIAAAPPLGRGRGQHPRVRRGPPRRGAGRRGVRRSRGDRSAGEGSRPVALGSRRRRTRGDRTGRASPLNPVLGRPGRTPRSSRAARGGAAHEWTEPGP